MAWHGSLAPLQTLISRHLTIAFVRHLRKINSLSVRPSSQVRLGCLLRVRVTGKEPRKCTSSCFPCCHRRADSEMRWNGRRWVEMGVRGEDRGMGWNGLLVRHERDLRRRGEAVSPAAVDDGMHRREARHSGRGQGGLLQLEQPRRIPLHLDNSMGMGMGMEVYRWGWCTYRSICVEEQHGDGRVRHGVVGGPLFHPDPHLRAVVLCRDRLYHGQ